MGSFRATLELGGKEFDVIAVDYAFSRDTDKKGKISSNVYGGRVTVTIESTEDTSVIEAMLNSQFKSIDASIIFKKTNEDSSLKQLDVTNAYIVYYKEKLEVNGDTPMLTTFTLSAEEMAIGNASMNNRWATK